ncbi:MAG: acyl-CoA thioesterase [Salibacteraceae bacterium]
MEFINQRICMGKDLGVHGNLFGGNMLSWIDEAAGTMAASVCQSPNMVTVKIDEVVFRKAVKVGYLIKIYGRVCKMGRTSVTLKVEARKHNVITQEEILVCETEITFVRIDEYGDASPIPQNVRNEYAEFAK